MSREGSASGLDGKFQWFLTIEIGCPTWLLGTPKKVFVQPTNLHQLTERSTKLEKLRSAALTFEGDNMPVAFKCK